MAGNQASSWPFLVGAPAVCLLGAAWQLATTRRLPFRPGPQACLSPIRGQRAPGPAAPSGPTGHTCWTVSPRCWVHREQKSFGGTDGIPGPTPSLSCGARGRSRLPEPQVHQW